MLYIALRLALLTIVIIAWKKWRPATPFRTWHDADQAFFVCMVVLIGAVIFLPYLLEGMLIMVAAIAAICLPITLIYLTAKTWL